MKRKRCREANLAGDGWDADDAALCHVSAVLHDAEWNDSHVRVGGVKPQDYRRSPCQVK